MGYNRNLLFENNIIRTLSDPPEMLKNRDANPVVFKSPGGRLVVDTFSGMVGGVQMQVMNRQVLGADHCNLRNFSFTPRGAMIGAPGLLTGRYPVRTDHIRLSVPSGKRAEIGSLVFQVGAALDLAPVNHPERFRQ